MTLGPQPGEAACCESCRIVAEAVYKLALALEYPVTAAQIRAVMDEDTINTEKANQ